MLVYHVAMLSVTLRIINFNLQNQNWYGELPARGSVVRTFASQSSVSIVFGIHSFPA